MSTTTMRSALRTYYGKNSGLAKRLDSMTDKQVQAIYLRLKNKGVIK